LDRERPWYSFLLQQFVEEVIELVELDTIRGALVGLPGMTGLSTEQRKRLTIAVELVANPAIIFMDEPTSGLDARAAAIVMRAVRNTVDTGRTVVCTIHQPSIDIFESFDEVNHYCDFPSILIFRVREASWEINYSVFPTQTFVAINFKIVYCTAFVTEARRSGNLCWATRTKLPKVDRLL
jgi:hypothetical protein